MHEFSTAVNIVEAVNRAASSHNATRVLSINLQIGPLSMLSHDQLLFGIEIAAKNSIAEGAKVTIEPLPIKVACKACGKESVIKEKGTLFDILTALACPHCGAREVEVVQGRECVVKDVQATIEEKQ